MKTSPSQDGTSHNPALRIIGLCDAPHKAEFGAAWKKKSQEQNRDYLSVKLDDPSFAAPIYATLVEVEGEEGHSLIWSRPNRD